ncbi:MAG: hypothetical protein R2719_01405 [Micropruina sp.]
MNRGRNWRGWTHLALATAGVVAVLWAVALSANPTIWCREQVMQPGQVCANAQGTKIQTYEERVNAALIRPSRDRCGRCGRGRIRPAAVARGTPQGRRLSGALRHPERGPSSS